MPTESSYEKINYALRPAKHIERKMLAETFRKLSVFGSLSTYRYIGFGSVYFSDFLLFHKTLDIKNMISIEHDEKNRQRFEFNRPFNYIKLEFGSSNAILPKLTWDSIRTILWLDYDGFLNKNVLDDVSQFCGAASPGSVFMVTVNIKPITPSEKLPPEEALERRFKIFKERVGENKVPSSITKHELNNEKFISTNRRIITNEIEETLSIRNNGREAAKIKYQQLFYFRYSDTAPMLTIGGILHDEGQENVLANCGFKELPYLRLKSAANATELPYEIEIPKLTYRELRYLDQQIPVRSLTDARMIHKTIPSIREQIFQYMRLYRYFPNFAETDI